MDVVAQYRVIVDRFHDLLHEVSRMRRREANAPDSIQFTHGAKQAREVPAGRRRIAVAVNILPQKLDFGVTRGAQLRASFSAGAVTLVRTSVMDQLLIGEELCSTGYTEIQLLGQNVNSYRDPSPSGWDFSRLLRAMGELDESGAFASRRRIRETS